MLVVTLLLNIASEEHVHVDEDTYRALSVFVEESHPVVAGRGKTREGLSLYSLVNRTKSKQGSKLLRAWLSSPTRSLSKILSRQNAVEFFSAAPNASFAGELRQHLRDICAFALCVPAFQRFGQAEREWELLRRAFAATAALRPMLEALALHDHPSLKVAQPEALVCFKNAVLGESVRAGESLLDGVIDFGDDGKVSVKQGIDENVDRLRDLYEHVPVILDELATAENRAHSAVLQETRVHAIYSPQIGFLTAVPLLSPGEDGSCLEEGGARTLSSARAAPAAGLPEQAEAVIAQMCAQRGVEFRFRTFSAAYFKTTNSRRCDERFGDVHTALADAEAEVLHKVVQRINTIAPDLLAAASHAAELDALVALALTAVECGWSRPQFDLTGSRIELRAARHPLLESCCGDGCGGSNTGCVVPNDIVLEGGAQKCVFLTGPNGSGKSVLMSMVGCIALLAQCGSFVPAEHALLPLFDSVQCHGHVPDSVQNTMSSFMTECAQVSRALARRTSKTLLLLDEFGKGTDPENGLALVAATLDFVALVPPQTRPWTIFVTHFTNALDLVSDAANSAIARLTMQCIDDNDHGAAATATTGPSADNRRLVFLFRAVPGVASDSLSYQCARSAGMPDAITDRAMAVAAALRERTPSCASIRLLPSLMAPEAEARQARQLDQLLSVFDRLDPEHDDLAPLLTLCKRISQQSAAI